MQIYDLTLLYSCRNWMAVENTLPNDLDGLAKYLRTGRLRLILAKTSEWSWIDNSPSNSTVRHYVAQWHHRTITSYSMLLALPGEPIRVLYKQVPWHSSTVLQNMLTQHGVGVPKPPKKWMLLSTTHESTVAYDQPQGNAFLSSQELLHLHFVEITWRW